MPQRKRCLARRTTTGPRRNGEGRNGPLFRSAPRTTDATLNNAGSASSAPQQRLTGGAAPSRVATAGRVTPRGEGARTRRSPPPCKRAARRHSVEGERRTGARIVRGTLLPREKLANFLSREGVADSSLGTPSTCLRRRPRVTITSEAVSCEPKGRWALPVHGARPSVPTIPDGDAWLDVASTRYR